LDLFGDLRRPHDRDTLHLERSREEAPPVRADETQDPVDGHRIVAEFLAHFRHPPEDTVDELGLVPADEELLLRSEEGPGHAALERSLVVLRVDDVDARRSDHEMIDVRPRLRHPSVVQDDHPGTASEDRPGAYRRPQTRTAYAGFDQTPALVVIAWLSATEA
jgi:hypothetical protein